MSYNKRSKGILDIWLQHLLEVNYATVKYHSYKGTSVTVVEHLRGRFREVKVHRLNLLRSNDPEHAQRMLELLLERQEATISDWGYLRTIGKPLIETADDDDSVAIDPQSPEEAFVEDYRDPITGEIDWDQIRDTLHKGKYADSENNKIKAGNAKGCIKRFVVNAEEGDVAVVNTPKGQLFVVFDGPARYTPNQPQTDVDQDHVFARDVKIARDENGDPRFYDKDHLPDVLRPNQLTMTTLDRSDLETLLAYGETLTTLATAPEQFE